MIVRRNLAPRPRLFMAIAIAAALALPLTVSGDKGIAVQTCEGSACCEEMNSLCSSGSTTNEGYYFSMSGRCNQQD